MLEDYAEKNGFTGIRHFTDDGISGTTFEREGLQAMLARYTRTYSFPKSYISYRKPRRLSVEQREKARERMRKINLDDI